MAVRTVRLDEDSEKILDELAQETGLSISAILKQGLLTLRDRVAAGEKRSAYEIYEELDLGPGGYAVAPSTESRRGVAEALRRKLSR
jgi:ribbon-helix-helix CopG family protein